MKKTNHTNIGHKIEYNMFYLTVMFYLTCFSPLTPTQVYLVEELFSPIFTPFMTVIYFSPLSPTQVYLVGELFSPIFTPFMTVIYFSPLSPTQVYLVEELFSPIFTPFMTVIYFSPLPPHPGVPSRGALQSPLHPVHDSNIFLPSPPPPRCT